MADENTFTTPSTGTPAPSASSGSFTTPTGAPPSRGRVLDNAGEDDPDGFIKNTGTGVLRMASHVPGIVGDTRELAMYLGSNAASIMPGEKRTAKEIRDQLSQKYALDADLMSSTHGSSLGATARRLTGRVLNGALHAPTGSELYSDYVEPTLGAYKPSTFAGRVYQAGLESAMPMPGGKAQVVSKLAENAPRLIPGAAKFLQRVGTSSPVVGGVMGATGEAVGETTGSPGAGIAASLLVPFGMHRLGKQAPTSYDTAADKLRGALHDPVAADRELQARKAQDYRGEAGAPMNLAEATGDKNLAKVVYQHEIANPDFASGINDLRGEQAQTRLGALGGMSSGDSATVSATAKQMAADVHAKADADTAMQQKLAETMAGPEAADKESTGKQALNIATANNKKAREAVSKLYGAIDPDNKIHIDAAPMNLKASQILNTGTDPRLHLPSPEAEKILGMARDMPPTMTFNDLVEFDKTVGQTRWDLSRKTDAGSQHGARMLGELQDHMNELRDGSLDRYAAWEKGAVANGKLKPDQTVTANLQRQFGDPAAGSGSIAASAGAGQPGTAGRVPPATGTAAGAGAPHTGGGESVSGNTLNQNELAAAAERQKLAKQAHRERKSVFEEGPVGKFINADNPMHGSVPGSAFAAGPNGAQLTRSWLEAGKSDPEMLNTIRQMAVNELHALTRDGVVTPKALDQWKTKFGSALGEIDKHESGFSSSFDTHAAQQQQLADSATRGFEAKAAFNKTQAAKFLNMEHVGEVDRHIGGLMGEKDGASKLRELMSQLEGNPAAQEGVRASAVKWLQAKASSADLIGVGEAQVNASAPGAYLKALKNAQPHMEAIFGKDGYAAAERVAEEMKGTKAAIDARLVRGGSDSVRNLVTYLNEAGTHGTPALSAVEGFATLEALREIGSGMLSGDPLHGLLRGAGFMASKKVLHSLAQRKMAREGKGMREAGDLIRAALLNPAEGHAMLEHGAARAAAANTATPWRTGAGQARAVGAAETQRDDADSAPQDWVRVGHAAGGAVKVDHAAHAARLVRAVPQERKRTAAGTEPMLKLSDNVITKALAIANQGLN